MEKVNIIFTYYENMRGLRHIADTYPEEVNVLIVDDGSPTPLKPTWIPDHWQLYRITKDIGWNSEGARNLGMKVTNTEWNVLCDLSHPVINPLDIPKIIPELDPMMAYNPITVKDKKKNSYIITKTLFWDCNGYDETYTGLYGYDRTLYNTLKTKNALSTREDIKLKGNWIGKAGGKWDRPTKTASSKLYDEAVKTREKTDERIRFPWIRLQ